MKRWIVSHFAPFDGGQTNSSQIVALATKTTGGNFLFTESLPVSFKSSWQILESILKENEVDGILALGQAENRKNVCLERVALNWIDAGIPDNDGEKPVDQTIAANGEDLWTDLAVRDWLCPGLQISYSAGTYVCNYLYYRALEWAKLHRKHALFVHFPVLASQTEERYRDCEKMPDGEAIRIFRHILESLA